MSSLLTHDDLLYISPGRKEKRAFDFVDELPEGDSIKAVGAGTSVTAVDANGITVEIASEVAIVNSTMLQAVISGLTVGEDYLVTYVIKTEQSDETFDKFLVVRCRTRGLYL